MNKRVSLSCHRNKLEQRRKRDMASRLRALSKEVKDHDIRAYAFVGIDSEGVAHIGWDTGNIMPMWGFASTCYEALKRDMVESGIDDEWKPPLPIKG